MKKVYLILLLSAVLCSAANARDFVYEDIIYTVLDENARTVETKAGYQEKVGDETNYVPGNEAPALLWLNSKVYDGDKEYTLTRLGDYSFCNSQNLMIAALPNTIEEIGDYSFCLCTSLYGLTDLYNCTIGDFAFYGCIDLTSITLPQNLEAIPTGAFGYCRSLKSIELPSSLTSIELAAFMLSGLEDIVIPDKVTYIGTLAFSLSDLQSVTLPSDLLLIGSSAFSLCSKLKSIYYDTDYPAVAYDDTFDEDTFKAATLYVPYGMKSVMESKSVWKNFANIVESDLSDVEEVLTDSNDCEPEYYDMNGMRIDSPRPGQLVIKRTGDKVEKIIM